MQGTAPSSARYVKDYITLVEAEEAQYPSSNRDTKLMLTRMRKIYYDTTGWNRVLIPGTANIAGHYSRREEPDGQPYSINLGLPGGFDDIRVSKVKSIAIDSSGNIPDVFRQQQIRLADGSYLDIGHVFAGLDAFNHPDKVGVLGMTVDSNVDNCTWVGDLGSVLAEVTFRMRRQSGVINDTQRQEEINKNAPAQDMLGNIDAYVIKQMFSLVSGKKVSEILREYYLGEYYVGLSRAASDARKYRFSRFARGIGLTLTSRSPVTFSNEAAWVTKYIDQINDSAAQYVALNTSSISAGAIAELGFAFGISFNQGSRTLVSLFLTTLKQRISAEPGS
ncbi:MAG: hypothetical protein HC878_05785 [Leptolyngbyaceae cyanobacterium SL_5_14]|nr:hypothetical protein [Leptolyngbyaceae cyanobacterium SL_5_14]